MSVALYNNIRFNWPMHLVLLLTNWLPDNVLFMRLRGKLASFFFKSCGKNLRIGRNNVFYNSGNIIFGRDIYIAYGNWFCASTTIAVDDEVFFGPGSIIVSGSHTRNNGSYRFGPNTVDPIRIGFGSWVGGGCAVLAGSDIGRGTVIGANTVVRGKVPDNCLYAGNPGGIKKTYHE